MRYSYDRTAAAPAGSLIAAKLAWAKELAATMEKRFTTYGGWRTFKCKTKITTHEFVNLSIESDDYGWSADVSIYCHKAPGVVATIQVGKPDPENFNILDFLQNMDGEVLKFDIEDYATAEDSTMKVSLWFSKFLNPLLTRKQA